MNQRSEWEREVLQKVPFILSLCLCGGNIHVFCGRLWTTLTSSESEHFKLWLRLIQTKSKLCWEKVSVWQNSLSRLLATLHYKILIMQSRNFNSHPNLHFSTDWKRERWILRCRSQAGYLFCFTGERKRENLLSSRWNSPNRFLLFVLELHYSRV